MFPASDNWMLVVTSHIRPLKKSHFDIHFLPQRHGAHREVVFFAGPGDDGPTNGLALQAASLARSSIATYRQLFFLCCHLPAKEKNNPPLCSLCLERSGR